MYAVYILLCADGSYYTGLSNDLEKRIWQHETGHFTDCYTYKRRPVKLIWQTPIEDAKEANKLEKQIKGWSRKKKEALINGNLGELKRLSNAKKETPLPLLRPFDKLRAQGQIDYLIIGQGISGTWLSYYLQKAQKSFLVIDNMAANAPSRIAAGIINPVTGRRHAEVWKADSLIPFARKAYGELGEVLGIQAISAKKIIDFFPSPQMRLSFTERVMENASYMNLPADEKDYQPWFQYDFGYGEIEPAYTVHLENILPAWGKKLQEKNALLEEEFEIAHLSVSSTRVKYKDITAEKIIFCDGAASSSNPWFSRLPFAPNKGEAITLEIKELPPDKIYKKGLSLVPLSEPGQWWIGSAYAWDFEDENPTPVFYQKTESLLKEWLKIPFTITAHLAGLRPATLERRPFAGLHPLHPPIGILNGMGTKGCSLAPFFARELADHLLFGQPITPEADVKRFSGVLSR